jgi:8-oxo-dGTP pyrophosphatase MutT (NUDIX family)
MSNSIFHFSKPDWQIIKDTKVFETPIFNLHEREVKPAGENEPSDFYVLDAPEWINIIALTPDREIVLVEQYRHGIDEVTLEIPGGMVDPGESPIEAAKRELAEETGFTSDSWELIGKSSSNPAFLTNFTHLYLVENCKKTEDQQTEGTEDIDVHIMKLKDFMSLIRNGTVHHAIVLSAVTNMLLKRPELCKM